MSRNKKKSYDSVGLGFLIGFLIPLIIFFGVFYFGESKLTLGNYLSNMWRLHALMKVVSLCVFGNLLTFMGFIHLKHDQTARGILGATIVYGLAILISRAF